MSRFHELMVIQGKTMPEANAIANREAGGSFAAPAGSAWAIVYAGKHYGRKHRILHDTGILTTVLHEPSGDVLTVPYCDVERETPNTTIYERDNG